MLVLPGPPKTLPKHSIAKARRVSKTKTRSEVVVSGRGQRLGNAWSPGYTRPWGEPGKTVDCCPLTQVWIFPCVSYQGMLTSQRRPRFSVRLGVAFHESCTYAPP